jgi:hypothetical protein
MTTRDEIIDWANGLEGTELTAGNGAGLVISGARWVTVPPYWLALEAQAELHGPDALWLETDSDVGWSGLLAQISLPAGLTLTGHDRRIIDPTTIRVVLRLST